MTTTIMSGNAADLDTNKRCPVSRMADAGEASASDITDGRPVLHRRVNNGQGENKNKSGKVLVRKNTPALLPKVDKIYAKDVSMREPVLAEEEESTCSSDAVTKESDKSAEACAN